MKESKLYKVVRPLLVFYSKVFLRPKVVGLENVPSTGRVLLAGTHTNNLDCVILISSVKRPLHFLAKAELFKGPLGIIFRNLGLISVDRSRKSPEVIKTSIDYLKHDKVVVIFPEGTTEKGRGLLPFKKGACKIAYESDSVIVPFVITGKYHSNKLKLEFLKPIKVGSDVVSETENLRNIIKEKVEN